jgi:hypothetical protein
MIDRNVLLARLLSVACLAVSVGCDDPPEQSGPPTFGGSNDSATADGGASAPALPDAGVGAMLPSAPRTGPQFAVLSSDYSATSVSLLDVRGEVVADDYINSGAVRAGLVSALSGDVALPTRSGEQGVLVLLDRFRADVITRIRLADAQILGQVKTHTPPTQATSNAYSSNPHDYVRIDDTTAWVTRQNPNLDPSVPEIDRGTDLLRIDPSTMQRTGERIDLSVFNTKGTRVNPDTRLAEEVDVFARPSRMVRIGDTLVVALARMSFDFSAKGSGMVALVDLKTRAVRSLELPGLAFCSDVSAVPAQPDAVVVGCTAFQREDPRLTAGIAMLRVVQGDAQLLHIWRASEHPSDPVASNNVLALGGSLVGAVAFGASAQPAMGALPATQAAPDRFMILDLASGALVKELFRVDGAFNMGPGIFDGESGLLLLPDASVDADKKPTAGIRRFRFTAPSTFEELPTVKVASQLNMPVRAISPL